MVLYSLCLPYLSDEIHRVINAALVIPCLEKEEGSIEAPIESLDSSRGS